MVARSRTNISQARKKLAALRPKTAVTERPRMAYALAMLANLQAVSSVAVRSGRHLTLNMAGPIGSVDRFGRGIFANRVLAELQDHFDAKEIEIHIDSGGGLVRDAFQIYEALRAHPAHITAIAGDRCMSAASIIFMAADERYAYPYSKFLLHGCEADVGAAQRQRWTARNYRAMADSIDSTNIKVVDIYAQRAGYSRRYFEKEMQTESVMPLLSAEACGVIHGLVGGWSAWDLPQIDKVKPSVARRFT